MRPKVGLSNRTGLHEPNYRYQRNDKQRRLQVKLSGVPKANATVEIDGKRLLIIRKVFIDRKLDAKVTEPTDTTGTIKAAKTKQ